MKIRLLAVGNKMPAWVLQGYEQYAQRMRQDCSLELIEINPGRRTHGANISKIIAIEGEQMMKKISKNHHVVALEVTGKQWSTIELAKTLDQWQMQGQNVDLLIGGPEGLSKECVSMSSQKWSLGPLTLPHPLVRIIVAEALYRAWSINHNHPYHRA